MNAYITRIVDMLERIVRFMVERPIAPAIARITTAYAAVVANVTALRTAGQNQTIGLGEFSGGVDAREESMRNLRRFLRLVNRTGRMLDADHPGIGATFRLPRGGSAAQILAAAEATELAATEFEADFVAAGLPASFLTELADLIDAFRDATTLKHDGRILRGGSTAQLKAKAAAGIAAAKQLDTCVRNHFRNDPEALGAWTVARHIAKAPRVAAGTTPPPATPPSGSSGGSGTTTTTAPIG